MDAINYKDHTTFMIKSKMKNNQERQNRTEYILEYDLNIQLQVI